MADTRKKDPRKNLLEGKLVKFAPCPNTDGFARLYVKAKEGLLPSFKPGQFTRLVFKVEEEWQQKFYTMASEPQKNNLWEFFITENLKKTERSIFSNMGHNPIWLAEPTGKFIPSKAKSSELILAADGTGIAPYLSMIRYWNQKQTENPTSIELWNGYKKKEELVYENEIMRIKKEKKINLTAYKKTKNLTEGLIERLKSLSSRPAVFLCGNPKFIQTIEQWAENTDWKDALVYERWW